MTAQLSLPLLHLPCVCEKSYTVSCPSLISVKAQCVRSCAPDCDRKIPVAVLSKSSRFHGAHKVSRLARTQAQGALFDYLHCTRSFSFAEAEHISKNSPYFLQNLLSNVDADKDVGQSLIKFLRYNPINEFEPFFESLGVTPKEITGLVPQNLMFLSDDSLMLENFRTLCDYGIPRSNIGKMLKEAREIFQYDAGVLTSKLRAYENLGLSQSIVIKLVTCCPRLLVGGINLQFVKVLNKLRELGIDGDCMSGYLSSNRSYSWGKMLDTFEFFEKMNYGENQMGKLLKQNPALLFNGSGKKLYMVFGQLLKVGINVDEAYFLLVENPHFMSEKSLKNISRAVSFLMEIGMEMESIANIVANHIKVLASCSLKRPLTVCRELKVGRGHLSHITKEDPLKLFHLASRSRDMKSEEMIYQDPAKHMEKRTFLLRLGFVDDTEEMAKALKQFRGRGDQLQERFDCIVQAGLDFDEVSDIVKQAPMVLGQSKYIIERKIDYLTNRLGYPLRTLVAFPAYLCYDTSRIGRRFSMYIWLRNRGSAKPMLSLSTILACSDARFVRYFVDVDPEGPLMWERIKRSSHSS